MYDKDIWAIVKNTHGWIKMNTIAEQLYLSKSTVQYMAVNDYSRPEMKSGPKKNVNEKVAAKICQAARKVRCSNQLVTARKVKMSLHIN